MATYITWQDVLEDVTARMKKSKVLAKFAKLKTNEERVDFCLRDDTARCKVQQWLSIMCSSRHKKFWEKASELRAEGNVCFQEKDYEKAVEFYTKSILAAPFPKSEESCGHDEELSLGFGNRSAALFHLHRHKDCLLDIERAIQYNYPRDLRFKLLQRKGQCYVKLRQKALAMLAFEESLELLEEARLDPRKIVKGNLDMKTTRKRPKIKRVDFARQKKDIESTRSAAEEVDPTPPVEENEGTPMPPLSFGEHPALPSASAALDVRYDKQKGRHIVANRRITAGDTLFVEVPYASVLLPGQYTSHCHHCYIRAQAVVPSHKELLYRKCYICRPFCHQCSQVRYCSQICCDESWEKYHKWECGNLDLLHSVGIAHLSCRIMFVTGLTGIQEFHDLTKSSDPPLVPGCSSDINYNSSYPSIYHLVTHIEDMQVEDTLQYALTALLMLMLFDKLNYFAVLENQTLRDRLISCTLNARVGSAPSTPTHKSRSPVHSRLSVASIEDSDMPTDSISTELFVGGLILHHILQLVCNANSITQLYVTSQTGEGSVLNQRQVRIATGIFPSASLMNHSCKPTVISSYYKNVLIIRAIEDVEAGAEVYNCYGPHYRRMSREDRQRSLLEQYFFLCDCEACLNEDEREQRFQALRCTFCSGALGALDSANRTMCLDCGKNLDCTSLLQKVFTAHDLFVQGLQLAAKGNFKDALERLKRCHRTREKVMYRYNRQLAEVQDQLACCYASLGKMLVAVEYLRPTLATTEHIYGINSIEVANELQKYSDLLLNAIAQLSKESASFNQEMRNLIDEAHAVMSRSYKILCIHYGPYHCSIKELEEKKVQLKLFEK